MLRRSPAGDGTSIAPMSTPHADAAALPSLVEQAQNLHGDDPRAALGLLQEALALAPGAAPADVAALVRLLEHVTVSHLMDGDGLLALLPALDAVAAPLSAAGDDTLAISLRRARLAAALLADAHANAHAPAAPSPAVPAAPSAAVPAAPSPAAPAALSPADRVRAMSNAAAGSARQGRWSDVALLVQRAAALAEGDDVCGRAYAALANNLAADLRTLTLAQRHTDAGRQQAMLDAAERARAAWARVGGWVEAERAEYQLALCHAAAGDGAAAVRHAQACLQGCVEHGADAFETFFAHEALVHAHMAAREGERAHDALVAMQACLAQVDDADSRAWGEKTLRDAERLLAA